MEIYYRKKRNEGKHHYAATITKASGIEFETIMQGSIGNNLTYTTMINEDVKNEIKENGKFVVEDAPF